MPAENTNGRGKVTASMPAKDANEREKGPDGIARGPQLRRVRVRTIKVIASLASLSLALAVYCLVPIAMYNTYPVFRTLYAIPPAGSWMMQKINSDPIKHGAGYIPEPIDRFLCARLSKSTSREELSAIIDYYVAHAGGRETEGILSLPGNIQSRVIGIIIGRLETYDRDQSRTYGKPRCHMALLLVEEIRTGRHFGKGYFEAQIGLDHVVDWSGDERWDREVMLLLKSSYAKWWHSEIPWKEKRRIDPLAGTGIIATGL